MRINLGRNWVLALERRSDDVTADVARSNGTVADGSRAYIARPGDPSFCQPYLAQGVISHCFLLRGDRDALQQHVCDRILNLPGSPVRFRPASSFVLLAFTMLESLRSASGPDSVRGRYKENEVAIWVLTIDEERKSLRWTFPYLWVDSGQALVSGREVFGYPKELAAVQIPVEPDPEVEWQLRTEVVPEFGPDADAVAETLIRVKYATPEEAPPGQSGWNTFEEAIADMAAIVAGEDSIFGDLSLAIDGLHDLLSQSIPMVFLKQLRDVEDGSKACYQAIVESDAKITRFGGGGLITGDLEVEIACPESHPIVRDLGLGPGPYKPLLSYWMEMDFTAESGRVVG